MSGDLLTMSDKELTKLEVIQRVKSRNLKQDEAARQLGITTRHIRRLLKKYQKEGPAGLVSKRRGKTMHDFVSKALDLPRTNMVSYKIT